MINAISTGTKKNLISNNKSECITGKKSDILVIGKIVVRDRICIIESIAIYALINLENSTGLQFIGDEIKGQKSKIQRMTLMKYLEYPNHVMSMFKGHNVTLGTIIASHNEMIIHNKGSNDSKVYEKKTAIHDEKFHKIYEFLVEVFQQYKIPLQNEFIEIMLYKYMYILNKRNENSNECDMLVGLLEYISKIGEENMIYNSVKKEFSSDKNLAKLKSKSEQMATTLKNVCKGCNYKRNLCECGTYKKIIFCLRKNKIKPNIIDWPYVLNKPTNKYKINIKNSVHISIKKDILSGEIFAKIDKHNVSQQYKVVWRFTNAKKITEVSSTGKYPFILRGKYRLNKKIEGCNLIECMIISKNECCAYDRIVFSSKDINVAQYM